MRLLGALFLLTAWLELHLRMLHAHREAMYDTGALLLIKSTLHYDRRLVNIAEGTKYVIGD